MVSGECHFVSRRVSEYEEREISSGKWNDSMVLSAFWLSVFFMVVVLVLVFRKRRKRSDAYSYDSKNTYRPTKLSDSSHSCTKYSPVTFQDSNTLSNQDDEEDESDELDIEVDFENGSSLLSEGVPLVTKT